MFVNSQKECEQLVKNIDIYTDEENPFTVDMKFVDDNGEFTEDGFNLIYYYSALMENWYYEDIEAEYNNNEEEYEEDYNEEENENEDYNEGNDIDNEEEQQFIYFDPEC